MAQEKFFRKAKLAIYKIRRKRINQKLMIYLVMVVVATVFWFFNKTGNTINSVMTFSLDYYGLPKNRYLLPGITTDKLRITVSARGAYFLTHNGQNSTIRIDISKLDIRTFPDADSTLKYITNDDIRSMVESQLPGECKCLAISPDTLKLDFGKSATKKVPVVLDYQLTFQKQYRLSSLPILNPDSVEVTGSINVIDSIEQIATELVKFENINSSQFYKAKLLVPSDIMCHLSFTDVSFPVEKFTENTIDIPVYPINVPDSVRLRIFPQTLTITYNIGWNNYNSVSKEMFVAVVDYSDLFAPVRPKFLPIRLAKYPDNLGVTNIVLSPESVEFLVEQNINVGVEE